MALSQGGSLIVAADKRILDVFEATTTVIDLEELQM